MAVFLNIPRGNATRNDNNNKEEKSSPKQAQSMLNLSGGFDLKTDLDDFVNAAVSIDEKEIADSFKRRQIENENLLKALDMELENRRIVEQYGDLLYVRCKKTGQIIRQYAPETIQQFEQSQKPDLLKRALQAEAISSCAPDWIITNPDSLQKLSETQPLNYFVFTASKVFISIGGWGGLKDNEVNQLNRVRELGKLNDFVNAGINSGSFTKIELGIANELMRRFLGLIEPAKALTILQFQDLVFAELSPRQVIESVKRNIKLVVQHEYRNGRLRRHLSYGDVVELRNIYNGFTNFRRQGKPKNLTDTELAYLALKHEFMPGLTKSQVGIKTMIRDEEKKISASQTKYSGKVFSGTKFKGFGK